MQPIEMLYGTVRASIAGQDAMDVARRGFPDMRLMRYCGFGRFCSLVGRKALGEDRPVAIVEHRRAGAFRPEVRRLVRITPSQAVSYANPREPVLLPKPSILSLINELTTFTLIPTSNKTAQNVLAALEQFCAKMIDL